MITKEFVDQCVAATVRAQNVRTFDLTPIGIGECDDCHGIAPLFAVSDDDDGAWAVCARCAR